MSFSVNKCVGFCSVEIPPSPKIQYQEAGTFNELSVNVTDGSPLKIKSATGAV